MNVRMFSTVVPLKVNRRLYVVRHNLNTWEPLIQCFTVELAHQIMPWVCRPEDENNLILGLGPRERRTGIRRVRVLVSA